MNNLQKIIESITQTDTVYRGTLFRWLSKQNLEVHSQIFLEEKSEFYKLKQYNIDVSTKIYCALLIVIKKYYELEKLTSKKNSSYNMNQIGKLSNLRTIQLKEDKRYEKREKVITFYQKIKTLRENKISWKRIEKEFLDRHKLEISHTYIKKVYEEIERKKELFNENSQN